MFLCESEIQVGRHHRKLFNYRVWQYN